MLLYHRSVKDKPEIVRQILPGILRRAADHSEVVYEVIKGPFVELIVKYKNTACRGGILLCDHFAVYF